MIERIDLFAGSLPRVCLWCRYGFPVVFGKSDWLDVFVCGTHTMDASQRMRRALRDDGFTGDAKSAFLGTLVGPGDSCDRFKPLGIIPRSPGEWMNTRKLVLLDSSGMLGERDG